MDAIRFDHVSKIYGPRGRIADWWRQEHSAECRALEDISITAQTGRVLVLLGPNGSGKTTFLKLISTMLLPNAGSVLVNGANTLREGRLVRSNVAFAVASERSFFPRLTVRENLDFFAALDNVPRRQRAGVIEHALELTELQRVVQTLVMKLSSGMYQRLALARALCKRASVLLLDEPTRSLDPAASEHVWTLLRRCAQYGNTVVLATHNFAEAVAVGDSVALLHQGRLIEHRPIAGDSTQLRDLYFAAIGGVTAVGPATGAVR
ncbi:MAG: ABC transporter ATP-binding protein [Terriglobales bacterium]